MKDIGFYVYYSILNECKYSTDLFFSYKILFYSYKEIPRMRYEESIVFLLLKVSNNVTSATDDCSWSWFQGQISVFHACADDSRAYTDSSLHLQLAQTQRDSAQQRE